MRPLYYCGCYLRYVCLTFAFDILMFIKKYLGLEVAHLVE